MQRGRTQSDIEPVTRSRRPSSRESTDAAVELWPTEPRELVKESGNGHSAKEFSHLAGTNQPAKIRRRGHALTYAALFLFTVILYARPYEFYPSPLTQSLAYFVAVATLIIFLPSQILLDGSLTARPREVYLVLFLCLAGLLSIPLALNSAQAWATFSDTFIRCVVVFIVMVNVVSTEKRLNWLLYLAIAVSCWLSVGAINDYRLGQLAVEGYRVGGVGKGMFGNSNDMALHLVTILPIAVALSFVTRGIARKLLFVACAALMMAAIVVTYSRGAFLGLLVTLSYLGWKLGRRHRLAIFVLGALFFVAFLALVPGNYSGRILSIIFPDLDPHGSAFSRRDELLRSINVALHKPLFGIGMGNYATEMSHQGLVTHNAFTQVAAEMGLAAFVIYTLFILTPLRRLGQIARETFQTDGRSRYYYLSVGLHASLLAYTVTTFFLSVAYLWYIYYLVAYAVCLRRIYEAETGRSVVSNKQSSKVTTRGRVARLLHRQTVTAEL